MGDNRKRPQQPPQAPMGMGGGMGGNNQMNMMASNSQPPMPHQMGMMRQSMPGQGMGPPPGLALPTQMQGGPPQAMGTAPPMMNSQPGSARRAPWKIKLAAKEHGFYSNMYSQAAGEGNSVRGKEAVTFFKRSGLPVDKLKQIWLLAARTSSEYLTKEEFYVALRLIAYTQNGMPADEGSISANLEVGLPMLGSGGPPASSQAPAQPQSEASKPEISAEDIASKLPSLDDLDIGQLQGINSLIPSVDQKAKQQQMEQQRQQMMQQQQMQQQQQMMQQQQQFMSQQQMQVQASSSPQQQLGDLMDPTGNTQAVALAAPRQEDMGFPKPQLGGSLPLSMSSLDSSPAAHGAGIHKSNSMAIVPQQLGQNDDPFAGSLSVQDQQMPQNAMSNMSRPSLNQPAPMQMAQPVPQAPPPFDVQAMTKLLQAMAQLQQTLNGQTQEIQQEQQKYGQLIGRLEGKQRQLQDLVQESFQEENANLQSMMQAPPASTMGSKTGATESLDFGFDF